ncbi:MAG TPA: alpha/beta fold hydrolase [Pyrinomonadaceae bacterium]|jgi:pimeloyl-ACP methyl ester carboxylesterase|nr:alpha/beta fold hydrolase [Pyrinomonadaceae bacterium]
MPTKQIRGIKTVYEDKGEGVPVVFVHGHPFDRSMWRGQTAEFCSDYRIIAPDLRGYGESEAVSDKLKFDDFAQDIAVLLDKLKVGDIVLCGLSMGGQILFEFYRLFPQRVRALVLADTFAQLDRPEQKQARYDTAERLLREGMSDYAEEVLSKMIAPETIEKQPEVANHVLSMMRGTPPQGAAAALRARAERADYTTLLSKINVPTLIVVGSRDEFTPVADAEFMHEKISGSELAVIEGAGHMPNLENPVEFNRILNEFLQKIL